MELTNQWRGQSAMELKRVHSVLSSESGIARHAGLYVMQNMHEMCVGMMVPDREEFFCLMCEN